jgi:selenocysteine lyase/cysteine desulfurase
MPEFAHRDFQPHYIPMSGNFRSSGDPRFLPEQFPILQQGLYLNHAAVGPWPRCTAEAVQAFAEENLCHGSANYREWYDRENALRRGLAALTGAASEDDIALLKNTTEGICTVAYGLDWSPGDNIVLPAGEFASNRLPWLAQSEKGVEVREVEIRGPGAAESALIEAMDRRTRLLSVSAVQWDDGFRLNLEALGDACRRRDTLFFVDAIQQLGALPLDVESCHADFLAADAHKWLLAPEGIAVFYCRASARPQLSLNQVGWHMFDHPWRFDRQDSAPSATARRFEAGSPNSMGQAALLASVRLLLDFGMDEVGRRVLANTDCLMRGLSDLPGVLVSSRTEAGRRSGIVSFLSERMPVQDLHRALAAAGVSCVVRDRSIRLSPHFYQDERHMTSLLDVLTGILEGAGSG